MSSFEEAVKASAEKAVLKMLADGNWIAPDYANRIKMPADLMMRVWSLVDTDAICRRMAERLNEELADRIVNHLATEIATDVKQLLSDREKREALRAIARQHITAICNLGASHEHR